ncbi:hypothetical protein D5086_024980 [Populus alba]|uniref:Uncharacterized protein n=1 Tax=Populus alba TaxID=43335 RepID=A0ACC4B7H8_POPAL
MGFFWAYGDGSAIQWEHPLLFFFIRILEMEVESVKKPFMPPREVHVQVTHSMPPQKIEIFKSLEDWAEQNILVHLKPVEKCWQPQDFLPDPASDGFEEQVRELRERAKELPDDYFVVLVGDMVTEEALPTYQTMLNTLDGVRDETGASLSPWAIWTRAWTAEENRHGDLLNKYLYLSGRVDMRQIEKTIQYLIGSGMDPRTENSPYLGFIYTSFQERATFISHGNTARHAKEHGDMKLAQICGIIAADEKRHETAYTKIVEKLFEIDPDATVLAFADMMRKKIAMPAHLIEFGQVVVADTVVSCVFVSGNADGVEELRGQGTSSYGIGSKILDQFTSKKLKVDMDVKTSIGIGVEWVKTWLLGVEVLCGGVTLKETNNEMPRCIISTLKCFDSVSILEHCIFMHSEANFPNLVAFSILMISQFQRSWGMDPSFMPSRKSFERAGRYDIARALEKWGGLHEVSRLLALKVRHPNIQANSMKDR